jgi:hypothetical protein
VDCAVLSSARCYWHLEVTLVTTCKATRRHDPEQLSSHTYRLVIFRPHKRMEVNTRVWYMREAWLRFRLTTSKNWMWMGEPFKESAAVVCHGRIKWRVLVNLVMKFPVPQDRLICRLASFHIKQDVDPQSLLFFFFFGILHCPKCKYDTWDVQLSWLTYRSDCVFLCVKSGRCEVVNMCT